MPKSSKNNLFKPDIYYRNLKWSKWALKNLSHLLPTPVPWYGAYMLNVDPLDTSQYKYFLRSYKISKQGLTNKCMIKTFSHEINELFMVSMFWILPIVFCMHLKSWLT